MTPAQRIMGRFVDGHLEQLVTAATHRKVEQVQYYAQGDREIVSIKYASKWNSKPKVVKLDVTGLDRVELCRAVLDAL